jgi:two-component system cell cycle sensor histidine kinase/response regulator CckA
MSPENPEKINEAIPPLRLLIADDDPNDRELCINWLRKSGLDFHAETADTQDEFTRKLRECTPDIVLTDYRMKGWTGMDALASVKEISPGVPVILLSGTLGDQLAVECIKNGVTDYVLKDQIARLPMALRRAREEKGLREAERGAAEALRESEERYRALVENAPEAIVVLGAGSGAFHDCNDNALRMFLLSREELVERGIRDVSASIQPDGAAVEDFEKEWMDKALDGGTPCFEWLFRNSHGHEIPCEVHLVRVHTPKGQFVRGSILDITERKRAEATLRESEGRYRSLVSNANYGIYWVTLEGEFLYTNPALARILGYDSTEDLLSIKNTKALFCDPTLRDQLYAEYFENRRIDATVEWKRKDGKIIHVRVNGRRAQDLLRGSECIEVMVEDVTERMALEKQLRQAQKFEAIGQLAGGIAHDFNNMLGAIVGWADLGAEETEEGTRLHRHFQKVRQQADRAAALTRQLLAFARRQILEPRNIDLNQSVVETLSLLEKVIGSNIEISANLSPGLAVVRADPTQVEQVFMNLCINARDAMPEGGSLHIETANISLGQGDTRLSPPAHPGDYVLLSVADTGTGMDAATLDRIFEPFFTTKELGKGTGLGLATVYGVLRQHGGFVGVESEVGRGSTFRAYLPVSTVAAPPAERVEDVGPIRGGSETILIAEDHDALRELAMETLTGMGYTVLETADGESALAVFQARRDDIDLLLFDVVLPKLSGPEVYARIHAENSGLPVLFATGYSADTALLQKAQQQGLPVIQKPYSPRTLARKVRETIDQRARVFHSQ